MAGTFEITDKCDDDATVIQTQHFISSEGDTHTIEMVRNAPSDIATFSAAFFFFVFGLALIVSKVRKGKNSSVVEYYETINRDVDEDHVEIQLVDVPTTAYVTTVTSYQTIP